MAGQAPKPTLTTADDAGIGMATCPVPDFLPCGPIPWWSGGFAPERDERFGLQC